MPGKLWLLLIGMVINVTGASFLWPLNTIYIHDHLGKSLSIAGLILLCNAGAGIIGNLVGGYLFDKIGGYLSILMGAAIVMVGAFTLSINHSWVPYVSMMVVIGFGSGVTFPAMYAMAGSVWPEGGRKAFNRVYVAQNLGVAIGAACGGLLASVSFDIVFLANGLMITAFFIVVLVGFRSMKVDQSIRNSTLPREGKLIKNKYKFTALLLLCGGYLLCWMAYVQWQTTIAAHTQTLGISLSDYSILWTINGALIVLAQPLLAYAVKKWLRTLKTQISAGIFLFICSLSVLLNAEVFTAFAVAMIIMTFGEMLVWPAVPSIANTLAPEGRAGFYQGIVNSTATGGRMLGPLFGGIVVDLYGISTLFIILIGIVLLASLFMLFYDKGLRENPTVEETLPHV
ncbi:MDR family MFS transporter [Guptibacillus hwajinpoensis]|uniref:MFS family permease n=1 Tax=Guptibacillus hwajinpoensis TaxID=208199 RepID=A0ABU0JXM8_9BACL|nr:MFS transporter [Alkalihalobacillus hemicentroti]MDQ0481210.1 MFS family permease [Alkalihalobacillus hemicentroti]